MTTSTGTARPTDAGPTDAGPADAGPTDDSAAKKPGIGDRITKLRADHPWFDHLAKAGIRYTDRKGDYLAAAITYFSVLAIFPLLLVLTAALGLFVRYDPTIVDDVGNALAKAVPEGLATLLTQALSAAQDSATGIGIVSLIFFLYSGLSWIANLRIGVQQMWSGEEAEPSFVKDKLLDLGTLIGLGVALLVSFGLSAVTGALTGFVVELLGLNDLPGAQILAGALAVVAALLADTALFLYILRVLPRQKVALKALVRGAILGAIGFEIIKIVASVYLKAVVSSPAYAIFGAILGLLFFVNLITRLLMFVVAWTSTARSQELVEVEGTVNAMSPVPPYTLAPAASTRRELAPGAILAVLLTVGAAVGALIPGVLRRWWRGDSRS